jgi:hypothetical protein
MLNSAFLVLYRLGWRDFSAPAFDQARAFMNKCICDDQFSESDIAALTDMACEYIAYDTAKFPPGTTVLSVDDLRRYYDPNFDPGTGVLTEFPAKSITTDDGYMLVALPYSRSLLGKVRFPLGELSEHELRRLQSPAGV